MIIYFSYGSNMNEATLNTRCAEATAIGTGYLEGYALVFTRRSTTVRNCGVADIVKQDNSVVWGVLYSLTRSDLEALDRFEGVHRSSYQQVVVTVQIPEGKRLTAIAYEVARKKYPEVPPSAEYMRELLRGAQMHQLPNNYLRGLEVKAAGFGQ